MAANSNADKATEKAAGSGPVFRAVMALDNSFHAPGGLTVEGEHRDAVDGFVVARRGETVELAQDHPALPEVQFAVQLGRAAPANAPASA